MKTSNFGNFIAVRGRLCALHCPANRAGFSRLRGAV